MYLVDNVALREKCGTLCKRCCNAGQYKYVAIESELKEDPSWPPVNNKTIDLADIFQRLEGIPQGPSDQTDGV